MNTLALLNEALRSCFFAKLNGMDWVSSILLPTVTDRPRQSKPVPAPPPIDRQAAGCLAYKSANSLKMIQRNWHQPHSNHFDDAGGKEFF